jgi:hypothetical protein
MGSRAEGGSDGSAVSMLRGSCAAFVQRFLIGNVGPCLRLLVHMETLRNHRAEAVWMTRWRGLHASAEWATGSFWKSQF